MLSHLLNNAIAKLKNPENDFFDNQKSAEVIQTLDILQIIFFFWDGRDAFMIGVILMFMFNKISLSTPRRFFFVDGVHFTYGVIEIEQKIILFLDIITHAAGRLGEYEHKRFAEGLRGTHSILNNIKLGSQW